MLGIAFPMLGYAVPSTSAAIIRSTAYYTIEKRFVVYGQFICVNCWTASTPHPDPSGTPIVLLLGISRTVTWSEVRSALADAKEVSADMILLTSEDYQYWYAEQPYGGETEQYRASVIVRRSSDRLGLVGVEVTVTNQAHSYSETKTTGDYGDVIFRLPTSGAYEFSANVVGAAASSGWITVTDSLPAIYIDVADYWQHASFSNVFVDTQITHSGTPSIRIEPTGTSGNAARECFGMGVNAYPGDHIVFKCWIKIDALPVGYMAEGYAGARIGIDLRYQNQDGIIMYCLDTLEGTTYPVTPENGHANYVHFGTVGWVQRTIDFIVPDAWFYTDLYTGQAITPVQVNKLSMWMQVWSPLYQGDVPASAWFADTELYVNPGTVEPEQVPEFPSILLTTLMTVPLLVGTLVFRKKFLKSQN